MRVDYLVATPTDSVTATCTRLAQTTMATTQQQPPQQQRTDERTTLLPIGAVYLNGILLAAVATVFGLLSSTSAEQAVNAARRREQEARDEEARYQLITGHMSDLIALLDAERRWLYVTPSVSLAED